MAVTRRSFLLAAASAAAGVALDPERALWRPGQKVHFDLHQPDPSYALRAAIREAQRNMNALQSALVEQLCKGDVISIDGLMAINPLNGEPTGYPQQFVVMSAYGEAPTLEVYPPLGHPVDPSLVSMVGPTVPRAIGGSYLHGTRGAAEWEKMRHRQESRAWVKSMMPSREGGRS